MGVPTKVFFRIKTLTVAVSSAAVAFADGSATSSSWGKRAHQHYIQGYQQGRCNGSKRILA